VTLKAAKPSANYLKILATLGDHIKNRRLALGRFQRQVAEEIGVDETTVFNWERNNARPQIHYLPRILEFLGYNPSPLPESLPDRFLMVRKTLGLTQKAFAKRLGIDPTTLARWERGKGTPSKKAQRIITGFLKSREPELD
jgi:transcriptional regulator with XRE-family HTH domain